MKKVLGITVLLCLFCAGSALAITPPAANGFAYTRERLAMSPGWAWSSGEHPCSPVEPTCRPLLPSPPEAW